MVLSGKAVDTHALLQTVWVGLAAGVRLAGACGLAMLGTYRAADARRGVVTSDMHASGDGLEGWR